MNDDLKRIQDGDGSKFNSAIADLMRIHQLLVDCNNAAISGNIQWWFRTLRALDREIRVYLSPKEIEALQKVEVRSIPPNERFWVTITSKLEAYESTLRHYRACKKLGIVANEDASTAALR